MKSGEQAADQPKIDPMLIPGIAQSGWVRKDFEELAKSKERTLFSLCLQLVENMKRHKSAWPFLEPVNRFDVPDYYEIINDPIDIKSIEKKLVGDSYLNKDAFLLDVKRIFTNAKIFNQPDTIYYKAAKELEQYIEPFVQNLRQSQLNMLGGKSGGGSNKPIESNRQTVSHRKGILKK